jgi:hypothetical protein
VVVCSVNPMYSRIYFMSAWLNFKAAAAPE